MGQLPPKLLLMMKKIELGIDRLQNEPELRKLITGKIALLAHNPSVDSKLSNTIDILLSLFGKRITKLFGPQHGFVTDVQDNMVETENFIHPHYKIPVLSLYGDLRKPSQEMLEGIDSFIVDLQDVGTRVYTYISTLGLLMEACAEKKIKVIVLDRPNPIGGEIIEGPVREKSLSSFVGHFPIPQRHAMTIGEIATYAQKYFYPDCELEVITLKNGNRSDTILDISHHWINPSPNLSTPKSCFSFVGTVLFEGTNISEGRGTTRALEQVGFPGLSPYELLEDVNGKLKHSNLDGFALAPIHFFPMFQKHKNQSVGGVFIHTINPKTFRPWTIGQVLCQSFYELLGEQFKWNDQPYEYETEKLPIDLINGTEKVRHWVEKGGDLKELAEIEKEGLGDFLEKRDNSLLY